MNTGGKIFPNTVLRLILSRVHPAVERGHMCYIIWDLFVFCITTYKASIPYASHKVGKNKDRAKLQEEIGRLLLWGDSYAVSKGELDILFENAKNKYLKESTVILLCSIARTLDTYFSNINVQSPKGSHGVPISPSPSLRSNIIAAHINNPISIDRRAHRPNLW
jgi:hypothetical protein